MELLVFGHAGGPTLVRPAVVAAARPYRRRGAAPGLAPVGATSPAS